jgi:hypothetical protein
MNPKKTIDLPQVTDKHILLVIYLSHCNNIHDIGILGRTYLQNLYKKGRCGRDRLEVGFTTTYAISAYYHRYCEFESLSGQGVQHYVIKFVNYLRQVSDIFDCSSSFYRRDLLFVPAFVLVMN